MASAELQTIIDSLREQNVLDARSFTEMRETFETMAQLFPVAADVECEPVRAGNVPAEWLRTAGARRDAALLYLHGGGYAIGSLNTHRAMVAEIGRAARLPTLVIDYRLAPEHPFPAAVEDATAAYEWLVARRIDPKRIVIAGDSAGGGLTVATLVALRDRNVPLPAAGVCLSPWVDLEGIGESMTARAERDPIIQQKNLLNFATAYLNGQDPRTPLAAPLYADLSGLPALLIQVGEAETLYDDAIRLAERARKAGVAVTLEPWPEMIHVWQIFAANLPEAGQAIERIGAYVRERIP